MQHGKVIKCFSMYNPCLKWNLIEQTTWKILLLLELISFFGGCDATLLLMWFKGIIQTSAPVLFWGLQGNKYPEAKKVANYLANFKSWLAKKKHSTNNNWIKMDFLAEKWLPWGEWLYKKSLKFIWYHILMIYYPKILHFCRGYKSSGVSWKFLSVLIITNLCWLNLIQLGMTANRVPGTSVVHFFWEDKNLVIWLKINLPSWNEPKVHVDNELVKNSLLFIQTNLIEFRKIKYY